MIKELIEKKFPKYFDNIKIPEWAREQNLEVYRACPTQKADELSFLNTYEENDFKIPIDSTEDNPSNYSLSVYRKFNDVKRFLTMTSKYNVPYTIAKGTTNPIYGICLETKEWKKYLNNKKYKSSHVDWWLYDGANPYLEFEVINYDDTKCF